MTQRLPRLHLIALVATLSAGTGAQAQAFDAVRLFAAPPGKDGGLMGSVVLASTEYPGSKDRRTLVLPVLDYQWANGWFAGTTNGLGYNFSGQPDMQYGLRITADFGRKENRSTALRGMGDIKAKAELGGFFNHALTEGLSLTSAVRYGSGIDGHGLVANVGIGYAMPFAQRWRFSVGSNITAANAESMQSDFGVSQAQAATSGYGAYAPGAGLRDVRTSATLSHRFNARTSVMLGLGISTLLGDAADSPLVQKKTSASGLLVATYAF
ncbi:MipA/OmpV family protein [Sphaerotilus mobilis]|uniref:Outer membrane scaffolding protein for murein synthesis (MipA/OmpV family) n=1 Tax=Sphaerotilus mobilis TaxID=47994 RepID=A0A4Q7LD66_9BURK|nr:MipA/OmpV family protein [Sphaerotilus mobilis]RZS52336.1 outer membrane scaffolding protein for murein synthesis (MipA/OmpV family) [Sphaerotilus mobilis]